MAFGSAFHRGSKENDAFESEGGNTSVAEYCLRFARRGYVACAIDHRLVPEDPEPGATRVALRPERIPVSRVDVVRRLMRLPPATPDMLWRGIEAASDDMAEAVRFVRTQAASWRVDPARIALGGGLPVRALRSRRIWREGAGIRRAVALGLHGWLGPGAAPGRFRRCWW
jgi:hypothetical protein